MTKKLERIPRLSGKEALILELLLKKPASEMYGLELVADSGRRLRRGTVYVTLSRMEDKGFLESRLEVISRPMSGLPRRLYKPTAFGKKMYELAEVAREYGRLTADARGYAL